MGFWELPVVGANEARAQRGAELSKGDRVLGCHGCCGIDPHGSLEIAFCVSLVEFTGNISTLLCIGLTSL